MIFSLSSLESASILHRSRDLPRSNFAVGLIIVIASLAFIQKRRRRYKFPPGPPGLPIIGNALQLREKAWLTFTEWKKEYGPFFYLNIAGQNTVVLSNHKVAADLLDRRAAKYSDRARLIVASELLTGGMVYALIQHNDVWRRMRRGSHTALNNGVAKNYCPFQERETVLLIDQIMESPKDYAEHICRASNSLVLSIIYGVGPLVDSHDPTIQRVNQFTEQALAAAIPGAYWVEYFTWMEHLPRWMCAWRRYAEGVFSRDSVLFEKLYQDTKDRLKAGDTTNSVVKSLIEDQGNKSLSETEAAWASATLYAAGAETTSGQMIWFILAMVLHPEIQKRAQEEIDTVVGRDRLPTFKDYEDLPYIRAMVKEILRWRGVAPLSVPHRLCEDDWYEGYFLPKDTICIANVWGLNHDPDVYGPDADLFRPERHIDPETGNLKPAPVDTKEESHVTYGFGRRICVGRHVANNSLFIEIAGLLWAFDIRPAKDEAGNDILPDSMDSIDDGLVVRPADFQCSITPRGDIQAVLAQERGNHGFESNA